MKYLLQINLISHTLVVHLFYHHNFHRSFCYYCCIAYVVRCICIMLQPVGLLRFYRHDEFDHYSSFHSRLKPTFPQILLTILPTCFLKLWHCFGFFALNRFVLLACSVSGLVRQTKLASCHFCAHVKYFIDRLID